MAGRKMTAESLERRDKMVAMRQEGKTLQQIADEFGVTRQLVYNIVGGSTDRAHCYYVTEDQCIYPNIRKYINDRGISVTGFTRMVYGTYSTKMYTTLRRVLLGSNCTKYIIDKILQTTGLPYEVAFSEEEVEL